MKYKKFILTILSVFMFVASPVLVANFLPQALAVSPIEEGLGKVRKEFPTSGKIGGSDTLGELIINVINIILTLVMAVAILFLIIGGYQYITSAGKEERAETGKKTVINAIIGIIVIILSYTLVNAINGTLTRGSFFGIF